jgi:ATP-dependent protease HslVU (ClpYQ) peptidase subunit
MTCIVGLVDNGTVYMGGDGAQTNGGLIMIKNYSKVFRVGQFLMAATGNALLGQQLRYSFVPPKQSAKQDDMSFMVRNFVPAVRICLAKHEDIYEDGEVMVGYRGHLYVIGEDYFVSTTTNNYSAIGIGTEVAIGAMFATEKLPPQQRIETALLAAATFIADVSAPFSVLTLEPIESAGKKRAKVKS